MVDITIIVNRVYKPAYNWGGTTLYEWMNNGWKVMANCYDYSYQWIKHGS